MKYSLIVNNRDGKLLHLDSITFVHTQLCDLEVVYTENDNETKGILFIC
jgi:hypothetical protein